MNRKQRPTTNRVAQPSPAVRSPANTHAPSPGDNALTIAIEHNDWERAALLLLLGVSQVARTLPRTTIDDVLALLEHEEHGDDHR